MYRTDFWTLWEKARVGCFKRTALQYVYYLGWNRSPAQVGCMRQKLGTGALGRPRGIGWRGRWEGGSGWGTHVNPWLIHFNVWQNPLQWKKKQREKKKKRNISTGVLSPPLALPIVIFPNAHLTSHSRMSGSRWVITPSWLSGSWRSFLYRASVYSCHLFLISSASVRSISFLSFIVLIFAWNIPLVYRIFLKISLVFPILLLSSISLHWSLRINAKPPYPGDLLTQSLKTRHLHCRQILYHCVWGFLISPCFGTLHSNGYIFPFILCL